MWVAMLINGLFLYAFSQFTEAYTLGITRFFSGIFQVFVIVYKPVYVDTFASRSQKPIMMSLILVSPPLGVVFGYLLTALILQKQWGTWQDSFKVQSLCSIIAASIVLVIPRMYYDIDQAVARKRIFMARKYEHSGSILSNQSLD